MKRRDFLGTTVAGSAGTVAAGSLRGAFKNRPNIIYVVVHDLGRYFSPYGVPIDTPNLQAFAEGGITLDNACCGAPPCSPSRACAMSGKYSHSNGMTGLHGHEWSLTTECKTIVDYLNQAGYETAWAGFQHERHDPADNHYQRNLNLIHQEEGKPDVFVENAVDAAIEYLKTGRDRSRPFYLNIATQDVHGSLWIPGGYYTKKFDRPHTVYGIDDPSKVYIPAQCPDNEQTRQSFARFVPCIRHMDSQFGRLVDAVDRLGLRENTLFIFTTDHGILGSRAKGTVYERGTEIGTIMQMPGVIKAGDRMKELVNNIDFLPTFLEAAGVRCSPKPEVQGRSFWARLCGKKYIPSEAIFTERNWHENYDPVRTVRTKRYHYLLNLHPGAKRHLLPEEILNHTNPVVRRSWPNRYVWCGDFDRPDSSYFRFFEPRPREELYDLENDPEEFVNLADDPAYQKIKEELAAKCKRWMAETNDPVLAGPIPLPPGSHLKEILNQRMARSESMSQGELDLLRD
ncbi:sulfatase family protein [Tichowtungia aerotolerans]|uniref:Sulfatase-like hydrolase/transferase n=1 Tax=Tichowtungia aerotolerans TaxID=2697043 RepID=A0A6P1M7V4_9BACT|nr:sulfatase [Tichowtungia aerotolerans]QHI69143.1 sulfatase-like hydrolase/transferase [Tichowtungia aerotolerans]